MIYYTLFDKENSKNLEHDKAYALLKHAVMNEYGIDTDTLELHKNEHGKPFFHKHEDVHFNLSHCKGMAVCAVSDNAVGIDCELIREHPQKVMKRIFSNYEILQVNNSYDKDKCFFRIWTLKEALIKNIGASIAYPLKAVSFDVSVPSEIVCSKPEYNFYQHDIDGYIVSVCGDKMPIIQI